MVSLLHKNACVGWLAGKAVLAGAALALVTWQFQVSRGQGAANPNTAGDANEAADAPKKRPPVAREERLWNIADRPFKYRLGRTQGQPWTDEVTLEPGEHQTIRAPQRGEESELDGVNGGRDRYVSISYPAMGGHVHVHLPVRSDEGVVMPNWFHVRDANGFSRLIHAAGVEQATAIQEELQKERPLTPVQIERTKKLLRANWVFYDN